VDALKALLRCCKDWGIQALTAYAFSTENWGRPLEEVGFLMTLFERVLRRELKELMAEAVQIQFVGDLTALPLSRQMAYSEMYITETLWPDFDRTEFHHALLSYQRRQRRFGKL